MAKKFRLPKFRFRLIVAEEYQPVDAVPKVTMFLLWATIFATLAIQVYLRLNAPPPKAAAIELPQAPDELTMHALSVGDRVSFGKASMLWLQAFDNQQGQSISFRDLDYNVIVAWLAAIVKLDERAQYPHFSAMQVYTFLAEPAKIITLAEFTREQFRADPATRWNWMAIAVTLVKEKGKDTELAIEFATELRELTQDLDHVPSWAKQMEVLMRSYNNEFERSANMLLNLLNSGEVTDPNEFIFLYDRLEQVFEEMLLSGQVTSKEQYEQMEEIYSQVRQRYLEISNTS